MGEGLQQAQGHRDKAHAGQPAPLREVAAPRPEDRAVEEVSGRRLARPPQDEAHRARRKDLQHPVPAVRREAHDIVLRLLPRLDGSEGYMVGASLKDAGRKGLSVTRIEDVAMVGTVSAALGA